MLVFHSLALAQAVAIFSSSAFVNFGVDRVDPNQRNHVPASQAAILNQSSLLDYFDLPFDLFPDTQAWGDSINEDPQDLHRIYFQNIDGIRNDADEMDLYVSSMAQFEIGTFCWVDHSLNMSQVTVQQALQRPLLAHFGIARSSRSNSILPPGLSALRSGYQPGGTFTATTGKWVTQSKGKPIIDPSGLGCWSGLRFLGKRGRRFTVLTAYRSPCQQTTGGYGFFDQQHSLLLSKGTIKPNVRKQFIQDIIVEVNKLQADGREILLSLDANKIIGQDKTDGIASVLESCTLHDLHLL